jgi:hypothetical protein
MSRSDSWNESMRSRSVTLKRLRKLPSSLIELSSALLRRSGLGAAAAGMTVGTKPAKIRV